MRGRLVVCEAREGVTYFGGVTYQPDQLNCLNTRRSYDDRDVVRRFAIAWTWLAYQYSLPQNTDSEFRQLIASAPSIDDVRRESLRRTQIQVELALHENRQIDAARLYRQALTEAPTWADGHFNQALIMGDLELFPHAIRYMQNYLVLAPDAPQARAAQDRIYQWEARRPARLQ